MAHPIADADALDFSTAYLVEWSTAGVGNGNPLDITTCRFAYADDAQAITVDVALTTVFVDASNRPGSRIGLPPGRDILRADNVAGGAPLHLHCDVPLSAAGAHVAALVPGAAALGRLYHAMLSVALDGIPGRHTLSVPFTLSDLPGSAPFVSVRVADGSALIRDLWFDVHSDSQLSPTPVQVAIDEFLFFE